MEKNKTHIKSKKKKKEKFQKQQVTTAEALWSRRWDVGSKHIYSRIYVAHGRF
jgi:hypothetical protein